MVELADLSLDDQKVLNDLRKEQDAIDREIVAVLARRIEMRKKISAFRIRHNLPTIDPARWHAVLKQAEDFALEEKLPQGLAHEVFEVLINWSHHLDREWRKTT